MKKSDFKKLIKETVEECIYEVLFKNGIISNIISEVMKGTSTVVNNRVVKEEVITKEELNTPLEKKQLAEKKETNQKINELKSGLMDSIGKNAYGGMDLFEGTTPAPADTAVVSGIDPNDKGVDISGIMQFSKNWKASANGKVK